MRRSLLLIAGLLFTSIAIQSQGNVAAQYPLRIHIFDRHETRFYNSTHTIRETRGEGRANLYEGGTPRGVNFSFDCGDAFHSNIGYETYPA